MEKVRYAQQVSLGQAKSTLIVSHMTFDQDGIQNGRTQAIVNIDSPDPDKTLKNAAICKWALSGRPNIQNGFVPTAVKGEPFTEAEIKGIKKLNNGYLVTVETEVDALSGDISQSLDVANDTSDLMSLVREAK